MLNFDFSDVADWPRVCTHPSKDEWHPVAHTVALLSMACGFNEIATKSLQEVTERIMHYQLVTGPALSTKAGGLYITPADIARLVGLRTNASKIPTGQWALHLLCIVQRSVGRLHGNQPAYDVIPPADELWSEAVSKQRAKAKE